MPIERRIREGAERNAGVLDPDVDRFLEAVVRTTRRRTIVRRSLTGVAAAAVIAFVVLVGPSVLDGVTGSDATVPGGNPTPSVTPGVTAPSIPGTYTRSIPEGTAVVRVNGIAGTWTIAADVVGNVRLTAPTGFTGAATSRPFVVQPTTLQTDALSTDVCAGLPAGTYEWSVQEGFLTLSVLSDPCDARVVILAAGPWAAVTP